ncbi:MAG: hypothetical protein ACREQ5_11455 [Candidatus Dormibacteria bacterium]
MKERWTLVYTGFELRGDSGYHVYRRYTEGDVLGRPLLWKKPLLRTSPGAVIEVDVELGKEGDISVYGTNRSYTERNWRDWEPETAATYEAMDSAATAAAQAASKSRIDGFKRNLDPLRNAYRRLGGPQRAILIAQIAKYIAS